jgi:hypothetical protein
VDDDSRNSDGVVIAVAIVLVVGLFAGGALLFRARSRARAQAAIERFAAQRAAVAARAAARPPRPSKSAQVTYTTATVNDGDFLATDSNGDWVFLHAAPDGSAKTVVFALGCGPAQFEGDKLVFSQQNAIMRVTIDLGAIEVVDEDAIHYLPESLRARLAATIHALPAGTAPIALMVSLLRDGGEGAEDAAPPPPAAPLREGD